MDHDEQHAEQPVPVPGAEEIVRPKTATTTAEIDSTIIHPGSVKINVTGAFIVDQESTTPRNGRGSPDHHQTSDIRLPNHTAVVSHIAIDVRPSPSVRALTRGIPANKPSPLPDWWVTCEARLLLARGILDRTWWPIELQQLGDRPDRRMYQLYQAPEGEPADPQWLKAGTTHRNGHGRRRIQVL